MGKREAKQGIKKEVKKQEWMDPSIAVKIVNSVMVVVVLLLVVLVVVVMGGGEVVLLVHSSSSNKAFESFDGLTDWLTHSPSNITADSLQELNSFI